MISELADWLTFNGIRPESGGIMQGFKIGLAAEYCLPLY
jgi:hypothetical protein